MSRALDVRAHKSESSPRGMVVGSKPLVIGRDPNAVTHTNAVFWIGPEPDPPVGALTFDEDSPGTSLNYTHLDLSVERPQLLFSGSQHEDIITKYRDHCSQVGGLPRRASIGQRRGPRSLEGYRRCACPVPGDSGIELIGRWAVKCSVNIQRTRGRQQVLRHASLENQAILQHDNLISKGKRICNIVSHIKHGGLALALLSKQQGPNVQSSRLIEVRQRLIHEPQPGLGNQGLEKGRPLSLASGETARWLFEAVLQPQPGSNPLDRIQAPGRERLASLKRKHRVLSNRKMGVQDVVLEHHGDCWSFSPTFPRLGCSRLRSDYASRHPEE